MKWFWILLDGLNMLLEKAFIICFDKDKICNMSNVNLISVSLYTGNVHIVDIDLLLLQCVAGGNIYWSITMRRFAKSLQIFHRARLLIEIWLRLSAERPHSVTLNTRGGDAVLTFSGGARLQMIKHNCFVWMMYEALIAMFTLDCSQHPGLESDDSFLWGLRTEQNFLHIQCSSKISMS